jgi:hypothetical protein
VFVRAYLADVPRGGKAKTTDQASAHVGQDIAVEIGHDHYAIGIWRWVGCDLKSNEMNGKCSRSCCRRTNLQACTIEKVLVVFDFWEIF